MMAGVDDRDGATPVRNYALVTLLNLAVWGAVTWQMRDPTRGAFRIELPPTPAFPPTEVRAGTPTPIRVVVHVAGAVRKPGLVRLAEGARIADAVAGAGGFADGADEVRVNLASVVMDGALLVVPRIMEAEVGDSASNQRAGETGGPAGEPRAPGATGNGPAVVQSVPDPVALQAGQGQLGPPNGPGAMTRVNINTASAAELEALPGIGPSLAARIVSHRESSGPFRAPEDLLAVAGIGPAILDKIADLVRVQ